MDNWESSILHVSWGMAFSIAGEQRSGFFSPGVENSDRCLESLWHLLLQCWPFIARFRTVLEPAQGQLVKGCFSWLTNILETINFSVFKKDKNDLIRTWLVIATQYFLCGLQPNASELPYLIINVTNIRLSAIVGFTRNSFFLNRKSSTSVSLMICQTLI